MVRTYYTLAVREDGRWSPQFGDYERPHVDAERDDYRDQGYKATHLKIIATGPLQADVDAAIATLNGSN